MRDDHIMRMLCLAAIAATLAMSSPALADEASVMTYLHQSLGEDLKADNTRVYLGFVDLDADGKDEAIAYVSGSYWCGSGGCNAIILTPEGDSWAEIGNTSVSRLPIGVLDTTSNGWKDLAISFNGGGLPAGIGQMQFDGSRYPRNPTSAPETETLGTVVIAEDAAFVTP